MSDTQNKFQCPACKIALVAGAGACLGCGKQYATDDGILDFVGGRFDTQLDVESYDDYHAIGDSGAEISYRNIRNLAADRWPASLGSVVEIGCGTGLWSRAMIGHRDAADAVLTDVSPDMLRLCRTHLTRLGLASALPIRFATYSAHEACFCDEAFDSCIGTSVVHHIADVRAFLTDVWRILRPGGRAFFTEPSFRYTRVMAMAFADIIAYLLSCDSTYSADRQTLHNWVAEARRGTMLQGNLALLEGFEDIHMFIGEEFEAMALDAGFATAEALSTKDPEGLGNVGGLLARIGIGEPVAGQVMQLWPIYARRFLALLHTRDLSAGYLFWLTKSALGRPLSSRSSIPPEPQLSSEAEVTGGGMPLRWAFSALAESSPEGLRLKLGGWCLANPDIKLLRVKIGGVSRQTPVWFPRPDVHVALNREGLYATWNSLCCGVEGELLFDGVHLAGTKIDFGIDFIFSDNRFVPIVTNGTLLIGEQFSTGR
jgi:ubiquinone/menaquinone biosynthesis C-methylase UbiE